MFELIALIPAIGLTVALVGVVIWVHRDDYFVTWKPVKREERDEW